jgi:putative membrane protein
MRKTMLKKLKTACILTTITGLSALGLRAADTTTTTGTSGYGTTTTTSAGTTSDSTSASHSAKSFIKEAYRDNQMEVEMGAIGAGKAQNADLKSFAQQIQKDHTQANKELEPLAQKYGVELEQSKLREHTVNKFEKETSGAEFDKKFATEMLKDHQKAISKFEKAAAKLQEADVKQYAENVLPKLREHLQKAETIARAVGVDQSTISSYTSKTPGGLGGTSDAQESTTGTATSGKTDERSGAKELQPTTPPDKQ